VLGFVPIKARVKRPAENPHCEIIGFNLEPRNEIAVDKIRFVPVPSQRPTPALASSRLASFMCALPICPPLGVSCRRLGRQDQAHHVKGLRGCRAAAPHGIKGRALIGDFWPAFASQIADFRAPIGKCYRLRADDLGL
jgi:hypothetical protein